MDLGNCARQDSRLQMKEGTRDVNAVDPSSDPKAVVPSTTGLKEELTAIISSSSCKLSSVLTFLSTYR